ncbi:MAG: hypothetical protein NTV54_14600 [Ignavibacteriales bacterium]|nr:hypothetical protein [Ignavibacteriales bacterium]
MPNQPLPCCPAAAHQHLADLPHVYQFDFDLYQCKECSKYWVYAWRAGIGGWEPATSQDAGKMLALEGEQLRVFMKEWAQSFD